MDKTSQTMIRRHVRCGRGRQNAHRYATGIQRDVGSQWLSVLIPQQIPGVDPFDRSPIKLQPYMHDLLLCCEYPHDFGGKCVQLTRSAPSSRYHLGTFLLIREVGGLQSRS